jgi:hypothetical protein
VELVVLLQLNDRSNKNWSEEDESKLSVTRLVGIHSFRKIYKMKFHTVQIHENTVTKNEVHVLNTCNFRMKIYYYGMDQ